MNPTGRLALSLSLLALLVAFPLSFVNAGCSSSKALWIEISEQGRHTTTIAVTEEIARFVVESKDANVHFSRKGHRDLVTRDMVRAVLDGRKGIVEVDDPENGSSAKLYMASLTAPGGGSREGQLVLETRKAGKKDFRMVIPDIEIEATDGENNGAVEVELGWKGFLPFLKSTGGALYIHDLDDDTEAWVFFE